MGYICVPHAFSLSLLLLLLLIGTCFPVPSSAELHHLHATSHSLLHSAAPSPAPSHHHTHHHHHHLHHPFSPSPAPSPTSSSPPPLSHSKPPTQPPVHPLKPPTKAPSPAPTPSPHYSNPPTKAPALAPYSKPERKLVAVQGVIYCKNCSYAGVNTFLGASPLSGATVELRCKNTKYMLKKTATTDKNGYFFLQAPKYVTTYGAHKCRVFLIQRPKTNNGGACSHATNLNGGVSGAFLFLDKKLAPPAKPLPFTLFTVGPFAFEPPKCYKH